MERVSTETITQMRDNTGSALRDALDELLERRKAEQPTGQQAGAEMLPQKWHSWMQYARDNRANGVLVVDIGLNVVIAMLTDLARAEAELVQIKERYATYRAASSAQAKLFAAWIEILKGELAAAQRERDELLSRYAFVENQHLCVGYKGKCDGDLEGIAHKETCPAREKDEILRPHLYQTPSDQGAKNP